MSEGYKRLREPTKDEKPVWIEVNPLWVDLRKEGFWFRLFVAWKVIARGGFGFNGKFTALPSNIYVPVEDSKYVVSE